MPGRERTRLPLTTATTDPTTLEQQDTTIHTCDNTTIVQLPHIPAAYHCPQLLLRRGEPRTKSKHMPTQQPETAQFTNHSLSALPLANARTTTTECPKTSCNDASGQKQSRIFRRIRIPKSCALHDRHYSSPGHWTVYRLVLPHDETFTNLHSREVKLTGVRIHKN